MKQKRTSFRLVLITLFITILIVNLYFLFCNKFTFNSQSPNNNTSFDSPIKLKLSISKPPALGQQATLKISIISTRQAPNTTINIVDLTEGFKLLSGFKSQKLNLQPNQEQQIYLIIKAVKEGYWPIIISARYMVSKDQFNTLGDTKLLGINVTKEGGSFKPPQITDHTIQVTPNTK